MSVVDERVARPGRRRRPRPGTGAATSSGSCFGSEGALVAAAVAALSGGHLLIEDVPGVGKTVLARTLATSLGAELSRVQGHPDLLPSDITGVSVFMPDTGSWDFRPGPVFAHVVLVDELNRTPPRTQSALLETMEERQVSVDGQSWPLPQPAPGDRHAEPAVAARHLPAGREPARSFRHGHVRSATPTPRTRCSWRSTAAAPTPWPSSVPVCTPEEWRRAQTGHRVRPRARGGGGLRGGALPGQPDGAGRAPRRQPARRHLAHPRRPGARRARRPGLRGARRREGGRRRLPGPPHPHRRGRRRRRRSRPR